MSISGTTPRGEGDDPIPADILVEDPHHPLLGRRFRVLGLVSPSTNGLSLSYEVEHRHGVKLRIPVAASERPVVMENLTKLSGEALRDLISLIELLDAHAAIPTADRNT